MRYTDNIKFNKDELDIGKNLGVTQNVSIRVLDKVTGQVVSEHTGHNTATNSLITGIGHYLTGEGVYNQGYEMLHKYVPLYISLGTMGLINQDEDEEGLPAGLGADLDQIDIDPNYEDAHEIIQRYREALSLVNYLKDMIMSTEEDLKEARLCPYADHFCAMCERCWDTSRKELIEELEALLQSLNERYAVAVAEYEAIFKETEQLRYEVYLDQCPGFGSDGSAETETEDVNYRKFHGLGPSYTDRFENEVWEDIHGSENITVDCELIAPAFPRMMISYREVVPEYKAEFKNTVDIIFSAMISTGALKQFREPGRDYVFITEAGLWSNPDWSDSGENGLLAGYRIVPPNSDNWDMSKEENRTILKRNILKVGINQVVQVVWKIQIGGVDEFEGMRDIFNAKKYQDAESLLFGHIPTHFPLDDGSQGGT